jgi:hypothetical protein
MSIYLSIRQERPTGDETARVPRKRRILSGWLAGLPRNQLARYSSVALRRFMMLCRFAIARGRCRSPECRKRGRLSELWSVGPIYGTLGVPLDSLCTYQGTDATGWCARTRFSLRHCQATTTPVPANAIKVRTAPA